MSTSPIGTPQSLLLALAGQSSAANAGSPVNGLTAAGASVDSSATSASQKPAKDSVAISQQALALLEARQSVESNAIASLMSGGSSNDLAASAGPSVTSPVAGASTGTSAGRTLTDAQAASIGATLKAKNPQLFGQFDANGDGTLTSGEISNGLTSMQQQSEATLWSTGP